MPLYEPSIQIVYENRGTSTTRVVRYSVDSAFMTSTDAFSFTLYEEDLSLVRDLELEPVAIYIDGNLQLRGRIEATEVGRGPGFSVICQGRDYIADLVECHVDPALSVSTNMTIDQIVKQAAKPVGIASVSFDASLWRNVRAGVDISTSLGVQSFKSTPAKDYKTNPGEGIYQFLSKICARFGCTLQPTTERNIALLCAPDYVQEAAYSVTRSFASPQSAKNNVIAASAKRNYSKFPTVVLVSGKTGGSGTSRKTISATSYKKGVAKAAFAPGSILEGVKLMDNSTAGTGATSITTTPTVTGSDNIQETIYALLPEGVPIFPQRILPSVDYVPTEGVLYRLFYVKDDLSKDLNQLMNVGARAAAERLKDCLQYEIQFRGHKDPETGRTYSADTIINVADEICDVYEPLWVERVTHEYEPGSGPTTKMTCWRPGSFGIGANT